MHTQRIVVGYDGSIEARDAVDWAAAAAQRSGAGLHVLYAYQLAWPGAAYDGPVTDLVAEAQRHADRLVADVVDHVRRRGTGVDVTGSAVHAAPAPTLLDAAADLLVVGNRGGGGLTNLLIGSVSLQVATHARTPVVVVRGRHDATDGPVVVGVDGSASSDAALGVALDEARSRGTGVVAVRAYVPPAVTALPYSVIETTERQVLEASIAGWQEKYPSVAIVPLLGNGRAAQVLIGASRTAQLVVVGSRGHGGFAGLLLGSVGQQLIHHAECPVLIVHPPAAT
ncbi:universal stress protein [Dactylosporangium aurantiacum]|uniref:Universal stress protein n=1 Tax=Dactylosporangium aurantiacum TaxID=35754 RepID=A0A9Q9MMA2_9ACTN|nr:universal stress protein [Dactylosporangium aurantiacum]MDG6105933.1 universal stress protein [Dactylosporangium aurantiacum]UWZ57896.1 universal stress protein [Dactylosporangium aurantiacum]